MTTAIDRLVREKAKNFRLPFGRTTQEIFTDDSSEAIYHPGEYGGYRERLLKSLLKSFLPGYANCSEGFIISSDEERSTQVDVIIFDEIETLKIESDDLRRFFPIETVMGVGEVKSTLTIQKLLECLNKLSNVKKLRLATPSNLTPIRPSYRAFETISCINDIIYNNLEKTNEEKVRLLQSIYNPYENHWQNVISFLVCAKINFPSQSSFQRVVEDIIQQVDTEETVAMRHNMLLSLEDGYQSYAHNRAHVVYPRLYNPQIDCCARTGIRTVLADDECNHIIAFISDLCNSITEAAIYPYTLKAHLGAEIQFATGS